VLAIGDVHGCATALHALLAAVAPVPDDTLVFLGDYVDRGPDSCGVLNLLIRLSERHLVVPLLGNHEEMMLRARDGRAAFDAWLGADGDATLASYAVLGDGGKLADVPDEHWRFLEDQCVPFHETDTHLFVHASAHPDLPLAEQPGYLLRWEFISASAEPHRSGKTLVCGHTSQQNGRPLVLRDSGGRAFLVGVDTLGGGEGWLSCWEVNAGTLWQASQSGAVRQDFIPLVARPA
jgi:serine/threonine protein phosphatase 1